MSHKVCPRTSLFFFLIFWTLRCSYLTVSVPQKVKLGGCRGSQGWWMKPIMQPDKKFLYNVILLCNLFSVWSVTGCPRMTVQSEITQKKHHKKKGLGHVEAIESSLCSGNSLSVCYSWSLFPLCQKIKAHVPNAIKHFHPNLVWM